VGGRLPLSVSLRKVNPIGLELPLERPRVVLDDGRLWTTATSPSAAPDGGGRWPRSLRRGWPQRSVTDPPDDREQGARARRVANASMASGPAGRDVAGGGPATVCQPGTVIAAVLQTPQSLRGRSGLCLPAAGCSP